MSTQRFTSCKVKGGGAYDYGAAFDEVVGEVPAVMVFVDLEGGATNGVGGPGDTVRLNSALVLHQQMRP